MRNSLLKSRALIHLKKTPGARYSSSAHSAAILQHYNSEADFFTTSSVRSNAPKTPSTPQTPRSPSNAGTPSAAQFTPVRTPLLRFLNGSPIKPNASKATATAATPPKKVDTLGHPPFLLAEDPPSPGTAAKQLLVRPRFVLEPMRKLCDRVFEDNETDQVPPAAASTAVSVSAKKQDEDANLLEDGEVLVVDFTRRWSGSGSPKYIQHMRHEFPAKLTVVFCHAQIRDIPVQLQPFQAPKFHTAEAAQLMNTLKDELMDLTSKYRYHTANVAPIVQRLQFFASTWRSTLPSEAFPVELKERFTELSRVARLPVTGVTYNGYIRENIAKMQGPGKTQKDLMTCLTAVSTFSGTADENAFICIHGILNFKAQDLIKQFGLSTESFYKFLMCEMLGFTKSGGKKAAQQQAMRLRRDVLEALEKSLEILNDMRKLVQLIPRKVSGAVFSKQVYPFLAGESVEADPIAVEKTPKANWVQPTTLGQSVVWQLLDDILCEKLNKSDAALAKKAHEVRTKTDASILSQNILAGQALSDIEEFSKRAFSSTFCGASDWAPVVARIKSTYVALRKEHFEICATLAGKPLNESNFVEAYASRLSPRKPIVADSDNVKETLDTLDWASPRSSRIQLE